MLLATWKRVQGECFARETKLAIRQIAATRQIRGQSALLAKGRYICIEGSGNSIMKQQKLIDDA
jgi:hypothetical protein